MMSKKILSFLLAFCLLFYATGPAALAKDNPKQETSDEAASDESVSEDSKEEAADNTTKAADTASSSADNLVQTSHSAVIQGKTVNYTATTGTMSVSSGGEKCDVFFIAYTLDDVSDLTSRPITFAFNGGPGSASIYTNFLCMGPKRMEMDESGHAASLPAKLIDNENSLLDITDLVFIDAIGTGYSKGEDGDDNFIGYNNDIRAVGDFIRLYTNRNKRWNSPKYIAGESYGTTRAVGLCDYLASTYSMPLNGLMLISCALDFSVLLNTPGNDLPYAAFLPTMAADAWYHERLSDEYQDMELEDFLDEVTEFVYDGYVEDLFMGRNLDKKEKKEVAAELSGYIGIDKDYILDHNLRIDSFDFFEKLLSDDKLVIGRLDGRYTGPLRSGDIGGASSDPSSFDIDMPLAAAVNQHMVDDLNFETDEPYITLSDDVNMRWNFNSDNQYIAQEDIISDNMASNSHLKIWVLSSYYDGATPYYGTEWVFNHVFLDDSRKDNLTFSYYKSGHMFYLDPESFDQFREEAEEWYD